MIYICQILLMTVLMFFSVGSAVSQWVQTNGPCGKGGNINSIFTSGSLILAGTSDGVYASRNNGTHWLNVTPALAPGAVPAVRCFAANNQYIFAIFSGYGVYRSSDDGTTWNCVNNGISDYSGLQSITVSGTKVLAANYASVFQTTDNGANWSTSPDTITGTGNAVCVFAQDSIVLAVFDFGIHLSTDYGATWKLVRSTSYSYKRTVAGSGSAIFAGLNNYILSSTDGGTTWSPDSSVLSCQWIYSLAVSPIGSGTNFVFAATNSGVFRSSDNGATWSAKNSGLKSNFIFSLSFGPGGDKGDTVLYAGTSAGIYRSTDYGGSWTVIGIPTGNWLLTASGSILYAGSSYDLGMSNNQYNYSSVYYSHPEIYRSSDYGLTWFEADSGFPQPDTFGQTQRSFRLSSLSAEMETGSNIFAGITSNINLLIPGAVFKSSNNGVSWNKVLSDTNNSYMFPSPIVAASPSGIFCGTAGDGVFRSTDHGVTWARRDSGITMPPYQSGYVNAYVNAFSFDGDKIYAGSGCEAIGRTIFLYNYIFVSTDHGSSWIKTDSGFTATINPGSTDTGSVLTCIYANGSNILVGTKAWNLGQTNYPSGGGIYLISNAGSNWTLANSSLMGRQIYAFASDQGFVFVATDTGIYRSKDNGVTWTSVNAGLSDLNVTSIVFADSYLFAATSSGVWKRPLSELTFVDDQSNMGIPKVYVLSQNYPNPFNPSTTIVYQLPSGGRVSLKVYDVLGREVKTLVNEFKPSGKYEVKFDGSNLPSGVYFYRLQAGTYNETKKLLLLK